MVKRLGSYEIVRETRRIWRVWWSPETDRYEAHAGLACDGFPTLREAKDSVEREIAEI